MLLVGVSALLSQNFTTATDSYNTAVGHNAGKLITTGVQNVLIGGLAGDALTDADYNVAIGIEALSADTLGSGSTAIGKECFSYPKLYNSYDHVQHSGRDRAGLAVTTGIQQHPHWWSCW